jgi:hypothetical protein
MAFGDHMDGGTPLALTAAEGSKEISKWYQG